MAALLKSSIRVEIENSAAKWNFIRIYAVRLPLVDELATCALSSSAENGIQMLLKCPNVCVQNRFLFAVTMNLGGVLVFSDIFKKISSVSMVVSLGRLMINDLDKMYKQIKNKTANKIYLEVFLTIKNEQFTPRQRLLNDIASPELFDFTFEVGAKKFPAHKFILSARSPVFARMLSNNNYEETQNSVMKITDTSEDAFKIFLDFIYRADVPSLTIFGAVELIKLAEKYDFGDLKSICETVLINKLTEYDSAYDIYLFAHQYNCCQELITKTFEFVERKYFVGKKLPANLCNYPKEVQRLVTKMREFDDILQRVHEDLINPTKKLKRN